MSVVEAVHRSVDQLFKEPAEPLVQGHDRHPVVVGFQVVKDVVADHVDVPSIDVATMDLFEPGDPSTSYIWHKLNDTQGTVGGSGSQMPRGGPFLGTDDLALIETWILEGCPEG